MGVLGLTPFIQKHCAEVIKELPNRLKSLSGKTIAIDGTLITQRLHFSPTPYPSRHVLGWYRLVRELQDSGVNIICVFDGEGRNMAKDIERERRRRVQRMTLARGTMEADRLKRLHRLASLLRFFRALSDNEQVKWTDVLRRSMETPTNLSGLNMEISELSLNDFSSSERAFKASFSSNLALKAMWDQQTANLEDVIDSTEGFGYGHRVKESFSKRLLDELEPIHSANQKDDFDEAEDTLGTMTLEPLDESLYLYNNTATQDAAYDVPPTDYEDALFTVEAQDPNNLALQGQKYLDYFQEGTEPTQLIRNLLFLFRRYEKSVPIVLQTPMVELSAVDTTEVPEEGAEEQYAMSKNQLQLTVEEGKLWASLTDPSSLQTAEETLDALATRSESLTQSYEKRNNPPTFKTYEESKEILRAMGIPCIDAVGPYEAEALAASLVRQGFADYVASEDTDVLIFEVPLLRNITHRQAPLTLISGADIRHILKLDRASFVDFALLLGTDFSQRIKNLGPNRAIKLIQTHRRIEEVIAKEPKFIPRQPREEYLQQVALARLVFETLPPVPSPDLLKQKEIDKNLVVALLERHRVYRAAMAEWDYSNALSGNYFNDNPTM